MKQRDFTVCAVKSRCFALPEGGNGMKISIVLFALTYILMLRFEKVRPFIALGAARWEWSLC